MRLLRAHGVDVADPYIIARTAWATDELTDAIIAEKPAGPFDLISLLIGVNDQYRGRPARSFASEFEVLLRRAKALAGRKSQRVIAMSIPDWGATPFAESRDRDLITREIDAYNVRARELAVATGARWIDITGITRDMQSDPTLVAPDRLHPSGAMYHRWAELLLPVALSQLSGRR